MASANSDAQGSLSQFNSSIEATGLLSSPEKAAPCASTIAEESNSQMVSDSIAAGVVFALVMTVGQRIVGFGRGILFCRLMTDQQLGQWSMVWSYMMLLAPLAVFGLPGCFGKFTEYYRQRGQLGTFLKRLALISVASTTLLSVALIVFPAKFAYIFFRDPSQIALVRFLAVALLFVSFSNFLTSLMESLRQVKVVTMMRFITGIVFAVIGTALIALWQDSASGATTGYAISCMVGIIPAIWVLRKYRSEITTDKAHLPHGVMWKRLAPFALWLWASDLLHNLFEVSDRSMLIHLSRATAEQAQGAVGQYHSGRVVPLLMVSVAAMLSGLLLPYLSEAWEANKKEKAQQLFCWAIKLTAIGFTFGGVLILLLSPFLFDVVFQGRYNDGLAVLPATLVYCIWFGLYCIAQIYLWVAEKGKFVVFASASGLIVNVVLNFLLIPTMELRGAVIATTIGNATVVGLMLLVNQKLGCKMGKGVWLCTLLPTVLLFGSVPAIFLVMIFVILCYKTELFLSNSEKSLALDAVQTKIDGLLNR